MKLLSKSKIETVFNRLSGAADVYVPLLRGPMTGFFPWKTYDEDYDDLVLDRLNVYMPPKQAVITAQEKTFIDMSGSSQDMVNRIIFGIRACDVQGIVFLDEFFAAGSSESEFYKDRREHTIIIANACYHPAPSCFCTSMGVDPVDPVGADVIIRDAGGVGYVWESRSEKGQLVTDQIVDLLEEKEVALPEKYPFSLKVEYEGILHKLDEMNDHPLWERYAEACQTCALCTYSCPTCYCLELQVGQWHEAGYKFSCNDTCAYKHEALRIEGSSSWEAARERFQNRFLHKLQFYPQQYGKPLCSGCGRCIVVCPANADITKIIHEIKEYNPGR